MKAARSILLLLAFTVSETTSAQGNGSLRGIPFYQIYDEKDLEDSSLGVNLESSPDGRIFYTNEKGIHTFDGNHWHRLLTFHSTRDKIRAIKWTQHGVFASGYGKFGMLDFTGPQGLQFKQINESPVSYDSSEHYSAIIENGGEIYFVGTRSVVRYLPETGSYENFEFDSWVKGTIVFNEKLLVATNEHGLLEFRNNKPYRLSAFSSFINASVITVFEKNEIGDLVFATHDNQLFRVRAGEAIENFEPFPILQKGAIADLEFLDDEQLALSMPGLGIQVIDSKGVSTRSLKRVHDYRMAAAGELHVDRFGTLWTTLNSSVGKLLLNEPLTEIDERLRPSFYYPLAHEYDGEVYIANQDKLYKAEQDSFGNLVGFTDVLPNFSKSVSTSLQLDDGLLIHAETEMHFLDENGLLFLGETGPLDRVAVSTVDDSLLVGVSSKQALLLRRENDRITVLDRISINLGLVNKIIADSNGVFWLEIGVGTLGKVTIDQNKLNSRMYTSSDGLPSDWIALWKHEGEVLFTESSGIYAYQAETDSFTRTTRFERYFPANQGPIHRIATDPKGNIWASYDKSNYILWKDPVSEYFVDTSTLASIGNNFANEFKFLKSGDVLYLTSNELFHIDSKLAITQATQQETLAPHLIALTNISGDKVHFLCSGLEHETSQLTLPQDQRSLTFVFSNPYSKSLNGPNYQYFLEGVSKNWSRWSDSSDIAFNELDAGNYTLHVRTRRAGQSNFSETSIPFAIEPTFWETTPAYILLSTLVLTLLYSLFRYFSRNLKSANQRLESLVAERTHVIENQNSELRENARKLTETLDELRQAQDLLMNASRKAGMAEVAVNVLHNVGNVLNSINVGANSLAERINHERVSKLVRVSDLLDSEGENLINFLSADPRGKAFPEYIRRLSRVLQEDFQRYKVEIEYLCENIEHVKRIVATQQSHARNIDVSLAVDLEEVIDSALMMLFSDNDLQTIEISRDFEPGLEIYSDKHRILQMVTNFIKNAKESIIESNSPLGLIYISTNSCNKGESVCIQITDNGVGISEENLSQIFVHGFTTKKEGHGFGMHSCANSAKSLGGHLEIESDGHGKGASVKLTLPSKGKKPEKSIRVQTANESRFSDN